MFYMIQGKGLKNCKLTLNGYHGAVYLFCIRLFDSGSLKYWQYFSHFHYNSSSVSKKIFFFLRNTMMKFIQFKSKFVFVLVWCLFLFYSLLNITNHTLLSKTHYPSTSLFRYSWSCWTGLQGLIPAQSTVSYVDYMKG